ncbi:hypothetical protein EJB05_54375, partial [Eragrostis curvula]
MTMTTTLSFAVRRKNPVLVGPATATPRETKRLSDIDDQEFCRGHVSNVLFYRGRLQADERDPAVVIRRALGEALVPYYPLAGRLREVEERKLVVDCTGEGVLFVEADADVRLAELEASGLRLPFPCMDQLLFKGEGSSDVLNSPLLLIQVTRLLCGGFVLALRLNHTMCDAIGIVQFLSAAAELARGLPEPTITPAWSRELLTARSPPRAEESCPHPEYDAMPLPPPPSDDMVLRTFTFGPTEMATIRMRLPPRSPRPSGALELPPDEQVRLNVVYNFRGVRGLGLPVAGYYGNATVASPVLSTAGELLASSPGDTVEMVQKAKAAVTADFVRSTADLLVLRGRPAMALANTFFVSDLRHAGYRRVDFGWGDPVYGGTAYKWPGLGVLLAVRNGGGENAVGVPILLPPPAMDRFVAEVDMLLTPLPVGAQASSLPPRGRL